MNATRFFCLIIVFVVSFGCAHKKPAISVGKPSEPASIGAVDQNAVPAIMSAATAEQKPDNAAIKLKVFQAVTGLEKYLAGNDPPNQDTINDLAKTASRSFNAAKDLMDQAERDQFVDKIGALTQELRLKYAELMIEKLRYFNYVPETPGPTAEDAISDTKAALKMASDAGAEVELLEKQLPGLSRRALINQARASTQHASGVTEP